MAKGPTIPHPTITPAKLAQRITTPPVPRQATEDARALVLRTQATGIKLTKPPKRFP